METSEYIALAAAIGTALAAISTAIAIVVAYKVHKNQKLLAQRQLILPLWEHMASLNQITPKQPITPDIIKVINTLELVALCCEGGMVDDKIIKRTFSNQFIAHYESIEECLTVPGFNTSGKGLLKDNRAATEFYNALTQQFLSHDRIAKN